MHAVLLLHIASAAHASNTAHPISATHITCAAHFDSAAQIGITAHVTGAPSLKTYKIALVFSIQLWKILNLNS